MSLDRSTLLLDECVYVPPPFLSIDKKSFLSGSPILLNDKVPREASLFEITFMAASLFNL